jgi:type III pantothenate kinase
MPYVCMRSGPYLLIDNSNSYTKLAVATRERVGSVRKVRTSELTTAALRQAIRGWSFEKVILASVVPKKGAVIEAALGGRDLLRVSSKVKLGVGIDYPQPKSIGADRLANSTAGAVLFGAPLVVVGFGTALAFDIISRERMYVGGVIAPGLEAMTDYLHQRTALLPRISLLEPPSAVGKSTRHAMLAGAVYGYRGLVRQILEEIRRELEEKKLRVVATGGYAALLAGGLPEIETVRPNLTLEGLRIIANLNFGTV